MLKLISFILHVLSKFFTSIFKINILFSKLGYETNFFLKVYYLDNPASFLLYLENSIFYEFFNETNQIFQFFIHHVFSTWRILKKQWKTIRLQRIDLNLKSRARMRSIRKKRGKDNSFYTAGSIGPLWPSRYFSEVWPQRVNSVLRHQKVQRSQTNSFWIFFQRKIIYMSVFFQTFSPETHKICN